MVVTRSIHRSPPRADVTVISSSVPAEGATAPAHGVLSADRGAQHGGSPPEGEQRLETRHGQGAA